MRTPRIAGRSHFIVQDAVRVAAPTIDPVSLLGYGTRGPLIESEIETDPLSSTQIWGLTPLFGGGCSNAPSHSGSCDP
jgi:hypothetical protein